MKGLTPQEFAEKLKHFCLEHGFVICGTCESESIYGEIEVTRIGDVEERINAIPLDKNEERRARTIEYKKNLMLSWEQNKFNFHFPEDEA